MTTFDAGGASLGPRPAADRVAFCGPYLSLADEDGTVAIGYHAYDAAPVTLRWGRSAALELGTLDGDGSHRPHFFLSDLTPGATYHYQLSEGGVPGPTYTFRAPPAPGAETRFAFLGDIQFDHQVGNRPEQQALAALVADFAPDLLVSPGDLVNSYPGTSGFIPPELGRWNVLFGVVAELVARAPLMVAMGNHEEDADFFWEAFVFPVSDPPSQDHYAFRFGSLLFVVLYTGATEGYDVQGMLDSQTPWLAATLAGAAADPTLRYRLVVLHRGPFSQGANHPDDGYAFLDGGTATRPSWRSLFEQHGVDLVLAGHNHNLTLAENDGVYYLTSCAGAPHHDLRTPWLPTTLYAEATCAAALFTFDGRRLSLALQRPDGSAIPEAARTFCQTAADCLGLAHGCPETVSWECTNKICGADCDRRAQLQVTPLALRFTAAAAGEDPPAQGLTLGSSDGEPLDWQASCAGDFLRCDTLAGATPATLTVAVATTGRAGTLNGTVTLTALNPPGQPIIVPVTLTIAPPPDPPGPPDPPSEPGCTCRATTPSLVGLLLLLGLRRRR